METIKGKIQWNDNLPYPKKGFDSEFDNCQDKLQQIDEEMQEYLFDI